MNRSLREIVQIILSWPPGSSAAVEADAMGPGLPKMIKYSSRVETRETPFVHSSMIQISLLPYILEKYISFLYIPSLPSHQLGTFPVAETRMQVSRILLSLDLQICTCELSLCPCQILSSC